MHLLMTGATGYVGAAALRAAASRGHTVTAVLRGGQDRPELAAEAVVIELADLARLTEAARRADAVVHCAASDNPGFFPVSLAAAQALVAGLPEGGRFATHGGSLVFGDTGPEAAAPTEFAPPPPLAARAELDRALLALDGAERVNIAYGSLVYGGGAGAMMPAALIGIARAQGAAPYVGDGGQRWSSTHVDAFGALLIDAVTAADAPGGPLFAAGRDWSMRDVAAAIGRLLGLSTRAVDAQTAAGFGMFGGALAVSQTYSPAAAIALGWRASPDAFEAELAALVAAPRS